MSVSVPRHYLSWGRGGGKFLGIALFSGETEGEISHRQVSIKRRLKKPDC